MIFLYILYSLICILLMIVVLMQSGRGGGLTESFAAAESMFGAKTNEFMVKATTVLAVLFLVMSLTLAHLSARKDQSLMDRVMSKAAKNKIVIPLSNPATNAVATPADPRTTPTTENAGEPTVAIVPATEVAPVTEVK